MAALAGPGELVGHGTVESPAAAVAIEPAATSAAAPAPTADTGFFMMVTGDVAVFACGVTE